ncbi:MAG: hypothetical protein J6B34_02155 [Clostridia bacterium]|nr:hypothetical protein [Clostridia bacterium]
MSIFTDLKNRCLPPLLSREEMVEIMQREVFGYLPQVDFTLSVSEPESIYHCYCLGDVEHSFVNMTITVGDKSHTFRVDRLLHTDEKKRPLVIFNNFHPMSASRYFPVEEMSEQNVDFISVCYTDVTTDDGDFSTGIAPLLLPNGQESDTTCGKIMLWAWTNMRLLDYGLTLPYTDAENVAVAGHSRLGKTALVTGMLDTRFKFVFSNAAGCAGDSLAHGNSGFNRKDVSTGNFNFGELICDIYRTFPFWFCKNYKKYTVKNYADDFDQHFLVATIAPRYVLIGCCSEDHWADPVSQQLCVLAASPAWEGLGLDGHITDGEYLTPNSGKIDGHVGVFMTRTLHMLSRHNWHWFMKFIEAHK